MTVTLLDTKTGERKDIDYELSFFWWSEGNGACDCSRELFMGIHDHPLSSNECIGCHRFLIVACSEPNVSLKDLNQDYPEDLLKQQGIV